MVTMFELHGDLSMNSVAWDTSFNILAKFSSHNKNKGKNDSWERSQLRVQAQRAMRRRAMIDHFERFLAPASASGKGRKHLHLQLVHGPLTERACHARCLQMARWLGEPAKKASTTWAVAALGLEPRNKTTVLFSVGPECCSRYFENPLG